MKTTVAILFAVLALPCFAAEQSAAKPEQLKRQLIMIQLDRINR